MSREFSLSPVVTDYIETEHRRIVNPIPVPASLGVLEELRRYEPRSMSGQPPVVWDRAEGFHVFDKYGDRWIDFSSGVLVTNAGHGHPDIRAAICETAARGLLFTYCFPNEPRARLVGKLAELAPEGLNKVFLLTTGSEAVENAIKLARAFGRQLNPRKINIVSFERAFHGRTLGAQLAGGIPELKEWIGTEVPGFYQVPFPDGFRTKDESFDLFEESLKRQGVDEDTVAAVIMETFQGGGASFAPKEYVQELRRWCDHYKALLVFDEVQAAFGRTGKLWGFEHYEVIPDIICCGKGITSSLPLSATISKSEIMDIFDPGTMTSTHAGHPLCCAAAYANIEVILREKLVENAAHVGETLHRHLRSLKEEFSDVIGAVHGKGLVAGIHVVREGGEEPDSETAFRVVEEAVRRGLMLFAPVGYGGATIKICPPLCITESAVEEGVDVLREAFAAVVS
ncbi:MAG: aspartate aminotransferase family protein [Candidatus Freyarchaeota archaeon]